MVLRKIGVSSRMSLPAIEQESRLKTCIIGPPLAPIRNSKYVISEWSKSEDVKNKITQLYFEQT